MGIKLDKLEYGSCYYVPEYFTNPMPNPSNVFANMKVAREALIYVAYDKQLTKIIGLDNKFIVYYGTGYERLHNNDSLFSSYLFISQCDVLGIPYNPLNLPEFIRTYEFVLIEDIVSYINKLYKGESVQEYIEKVIVIDETRMKQISMLNLTYLLNKDYIGVPNIEMLASKDKTIKDMADQILINNINKYIL